MRLQLDKLNCFSHWSCLYEPSFPKSNVLIKKGKHSALIYNIFGSVALETHNILVLWTWHHT